MKDLALEQETLGGGFLSNSGVNQQHHKGHCLWEIIIFFKSEDKDKALTNNGKPLLTTTTIQYLSISSEN